MTTNTYRTIAEVEADATLTRDEMAAEWTAEDQAHADRQAATRRHASGRPLWAGSWA